MFNILILEMKIQVTLGFQGALVRMVIIAETKAANSDEDERGRGH